MTPSGHATPAPDACSVGFDRAARFLRIAALFGQKRNRDVGAFLEEGAVVGFCARDSGDVARTNDELRSRGNVTGSIVDVGDGDALAAWVERSAEAFGGLDVVVANVSALAIPDTEENWQTSLNVDVMHTVRLVRAALPHLERSDAASMSRGASSSPWSTMI